MGREALTGYPAVVGVVDEFEEFAGAAGGWPVGG